MGVLRLALVALAITAASAQPGGARVFAQQGCIEKVPRTPADLMATPRTKSIDVAWNSPSGDACVDTYDYVVYKAGSMRPRSASPQRVREYSATIDNLEPNTEYVVEVTSVNTMKGSSPPAKITVKTLKECNWLAKPGTINPVFMNQGSSSTLYISWLPPKGNACVDDYQIEGFDVRTNKRVLNAATLKPKTKAVGLTPGNDYKFLITARNKRGAGDATRVTYKMTPQFRVGASGSVPAGRRMLKA